MHVIGADRSEHTEHQAGPPQRAVRPMHRFLYGMGYLSVALTTDMTLTWILKRYRPDPADPRWHVLTSAGAKSCMSASPWAAAGATARRVNAHAASHVFV